MNHGETLSASELQDWILAAWDDAERLRELVLQALDLGWGEQLLDAAQRLRSIDPDSGRAAVVHAAVLRACAAHSRAEEVLVQYISGGGGNADTWFALAPLAAWRGSDDDVATALDSALQCDPDHAEALAWGAKYYRRRQGRSEAEQWLERHAARSWRARCLLGEAQLRRDGLGAALEQFGAACDMQPDAEGPLLQAARVLAAAGHDAEAARLVVRHWRGARGPWPLVEGIEAVLRLGRAGEAVLLLARLRGLPVTPELYPVLRDLDVRVDEARRDAGL